MSLLIGDAMAATTSAASAPGDGMFSFLMLGAIFVLFYFMLIRPQNKRAKEHRELISKLKKGDEIITSGGMLAKIVSLDDQFVKISLADGVEVVMQRQAISSVLPKGTLKSI